MSERIVKKTDLGAFARAIAGGRRLVGPAADRTGARYVDIDDPASFCLDGARPTLSAKAFVLPQVETLLRFSPDSVEEATDVGCETLLFGVRPCDARAMTLLDRVFRWDGIDDPYYVARRERTVTVALACESPGAACFCTAVGGGPAGTEGTDLLLVDLGDRFLVAPTTDRGGSILSEAEAITGPASDADRAAATAQAEAAAARIGPVDVPSDLGGLHAAFDDPMWEELASACLGCGICTYTCPTCHCFDMTDEARRGHGHRVRSWDACAYSSFTLHGSGHNPRATQGARLRQRIFHKFLYCPENFDEIFCVGCGRCVTECPTGIDLRAILARLSATAATPGGE
jgi:sulfhydrogenase subunit beta (sulfur reductase)